MHYLGKYISQGQCDLSKGFCSTLINLKITTSDEKHSLGT